MSVITEMMMSVFARKLRQPILLRNPVTVLTHIITTILTRTITILTPTMVLVGTGR